MRSSERLSGIQLPLFSLRSKSDFGMGDFGALDHLFEWMDAARQRVLMLLPLLPTAPGDPSPYATRSALGFNPLYINLGNVLEFAEAGAWEIFTPEERAVLEEARSSPSIRYDRVFPLKGKALRRAFDDFYELHWKTKSARAQSLAQYQQEQAAWLSVYTLYAAISHDRHYAAWWEWPAELQDRIPQALEAEKERLSREVLFHAWQQWVAEQQWNEVRASARKRGIRLCGDEPFIISSDSADAWAFPHLLRRDARLGVPPDDFSATGQDWGLPYFDVPAMEAERFTWLRRRADKSAAYYDMRRVDHAVGYFRQWIRDAQTPIGCFLPGEEPQQQARGAQIFSQLCQTADIVAEDLGVIPHFVRETLTSLGVPGYRVLRWERDGGNFRNPHDFPELSLVTTGTHDTETLREWWQNAQPYEREGVARAYPEFEHLRNPPAELTPDVHRAWLASALNARSRLCVLPWQDVLATHERINLPGTMSNDNWTYRIKQPVEELLTREETKKGAALLSELTHAGGR